MTGTDAPKKPGRKVNPAAKKNDPGYVLRSYFLPIDVLANVDLLALARPNQDKSDLVAEALRGYLKAHQKTVAAARKLIGG